MINGFMFVNAEISCLDMEQIHATDIDIVEGAKLSTDVERTLQNFLYRHRPRNMALDSYIIRVISHKPSPPTTRSYYKV